MAGTDKTSIDKTSTDWKQELSPTQYRVLREHGTERPGSSPLNDEKRDGQFLCAGCGQPLYSSETKYESGSGWPSFWAPLPDAVATSTDYKLAYPRVEVHCARCEGHLGHVFEDGPQPTGLRFCMNGAAMTFVPEEESKDKET
ncbi:peptide-methionine (R)-S-oxide reductase MsrB [Azospirillum doebereinerae]